ncbi:30S ribosomal protein S20 [Roseospirillum parvum]|uniref:Small ribosomal subunit protein bS20 n=1 Tax=Roseospirillum parvum TaxID=83401 RepID=A0A1G7ZVK4_9PROT|nr:30S ribosomal protein S20 [Roseospirillum parvum]SDH12708.1 small subunit ribosomal protein S20 [Roseospirillum parvum]
MANHKSAKTRIRRNERRRVINHARMMRIRSFIKRVHGAIASGDPAAALTAFREAETEIMRGANKGVLHKNTASRTVSRLSARVRDLAGAQ